MTQSQSVSIIIPTHNRGDVLSRCLTHLYDQSYPPQLMEILVIDDGSTDHTKPLVREIARNAAVPTRYFQQEQKGPATARNVGIRAAEGNLVAFIGDDILATPTWVEDHVNAHNRRGNKSNVAVLGFTTWAPDIRRTPLMAYLEEDAPFPQFEYKNISTPENLPYRFFYTSNLTMHREFLDEHGMFDEDFPYAYGEDGELAYRLTRAGLRIVYEPNILAYHYHPTTFRSLCRRLGQAGEASVLFLHKHNELASPFDLQTPVFFGKKRFLRLVWPFIEIMLPIVGQLGIDIRRKYLRILYDMACHNHFQQGVHRALGRLRETDGQQ